MDVIDGKQVIIAGGIAYTSTTANSYDHALFTEIFGTVKDLSAVKSVTDPENCVISLASCVATPFSTLDNVQDW